MHLSRIQLIVMFCFMILYVIAFYWLVCAHTGLILFYLFIYLVSIKCLWKALCVAVYVDGCTN